MGGNCRKKEEKREENRFRAKSIKTRIETIMALNYIPNTLNVLEQNPSKQGLKPNSQASE